MRNLKPILILGLAVIMVIAILIIPACKPTEPEVVTETVIETVIETVTETVEVEKEGAIQIGYAAPWLRDVGQVVIMQGLVDGAMELGWQTITTNADGSVAKQINDIDNLITMGVKAIVSVPQDSAAIVPAVEKANEAGIPFFTIDRTAMGGETVLTVLANNYIAGQQAGEQVVKLLTDKYGEPKGKVLELQGDLATNVAQLRGGGFDDVIANYPDIELIQMPTKWDPKVGADVTEDVLTTDPDLDAIYFHSEYTGAGVMPALERLGRLVPAGEEDHIIVVGIDGTSEALDWIREGTMDATAAQPLYDYGIVCTGYIKNYLEGIEITTGTVEKEGALWSPAEIVEGDYGLELQLSTTLVTKENVDDPGLWGNVLSVE